MVTYMKRSSDGVTVVYLENRKVGEIKSVQGGYQYSPKGSKLKGVVLPTLGAVKRTLEIDERG